MIRPSPPGGWGCVGTRDRDDRRVRRRRAAGRRRACDRLVPPPRWSRCCRSSRRRSQAGSSRVRSARRAAMPTSNSWPSSASCGRGSTSSPSAYSGDRATPLRFPESGGVRGGGPAALRAKAGTESTIAPPGRASACHAKREHGVAPASRLYEGGLAVIHEGAGRVKAWSGATDGGASRVGRRPGRVRRRSSHPFGRAGRAGVSCGARGLHQAPRPQLPNSFSSPSP